MSNVVRAVVLRDYPFLWCWEVEDATGRLLESSWNDRWDAFSTAEDAVRDARVRLAGARAAARGATPAAPRVLVIVGRREAALYESLTEVFRARPGVHVIRDRRSGERRRHDGRGRAVERRRRDGRCRAEVDAQIRTLGWSAAVFPTTSSLGGSIDQAPAAIPRLRGMEPA